MNTDGSNDGNDAIASIAPVCGSRTTAAPAFGLQVAALGFDEGAGVLDAGLQRLLGQLLVCASIVSQTSLPGHGRLSDPAEVLPRRVHPVLDQPLRSGQVALV